MSTDKQTERQKAKGALEFIIPILEKYGFRWCITGGFAAYAYGVDRPLSDIDIDVDCSKDDAKFKEFYAELEPQMTQPLEHLLDQNYDNYNFEITIGGQVIDICPMAEMKVIDKASGTYQPFYEGGYPEVEIIDFEGVKLPLLSKPLVIKNKEMLAWQRESDSRDIAGLKSLLQV